MRLFWAKIVLISHCAGVAGLCLGATDSFRPPRARETSEQTLQRIHSAVSAIRAEKNFLERIRAPHTVQIIDDNFAALEKRVQMIRSARKTIELETYIFGSDISSRVILNELAKRARDGVMVRVLVDMHGAGPRLKGSGGLARLVAGLGIEFKFFNDTFILNIPKVNYRTHRKMLIIDAEAGAVSENSQLMVGGRNIADDYFGLDPKFNYTDRDVFLQGNVAKTAQGSFNAFWESKYATPPPRVRQPKTEQDALDGIHLDEQERAEYARTSAIGRAQLQRAPVFRSDNLTFASDKPGQTKSDRVLTPFIWRILLQAKKGITFENFTFIKTRESLAILQEITRKKVPVTIYTNALYFQGSRGMTHLAYSDQRELTRNGIRVFGRDGHSPPEEMSGSPTSGMRWTIHTKTFTADDDTYIGSYNLDPRSQDINAEIGVILHDHPLIANHSRLSILERAQEKGAQLLGTGEYDADENERVKRNWGGRVVDKVLHLLLAPIRKQL